MKVRVRQGTTSSKAGKIFLTLFLSIFFIMGMFTLVAVVIDSWRLVESYTWSKVPCVIEASRAVDRPSRSDAPYHFEVSYRYRVDEVDYRSDVYTRKYDGSDSVTEPQRLVARFAPGIQTHCFVDEDDPNRVMLRRDSLLGLLFLLVPFAFIIPGLGGIIAVWYPWEAKKSAGAVQSISEGKVKSARWAGRGCLALFFGVFLAFGLGFLIPFVLVPYYQVVQARSWVEVPCTIDRSWVESHKGDDSTTYSIEVLYTYEYEGQTLRSDRYDFSTGSDSSYDKKQAIVDSLEPGSTVSCWVDPEDPLSAVISRSGPPFWVALIILPFALVGLVGVGYALFFMGRKKGATSSRQTAAAETTRPRELLGAAFESATTEAATRDGSLRSATDQLELEPTAGPVAKFWGMLFISLFWNGIISVFVWQAYSSYKSGVVEGCLILFLIPFVLVGLLLLISVPYQFLAMWNPKPKLVLMPGGLEVGSAAILRWEFTGSAGRLSKFTLVLEGQEKARYRRGTNTYTATDTFHREILVERERGLPLGQGEVRIEIPPDTMHSFDGGHNKIEWVLKLAGEIRVWPDVGYEYPIEIRAAGGAS